MNARAEAVKTLRLLADMIEQGRNVVSINEEQAFEPYTDPFIEGFRKGNFTLSVTVEPAKPVE